MKKSLLFTTFMMVSYGACAQFEVNQDSHAALNTCTSDNYVFSINGSTGITGGFYVNRSTLLVPANGTPISSAVYRHITHQGDAFSQGIRGYATNVPGIETGRTFGVMGVACGATSGYNYGLFGTLAGTTNGSAVYATTSASDYGQEA